MSEQEKLDPRQDAPLAQVRHESAQTEANPRRISQATAESALHSRGSPIRSGRVRFNRASRFCCSALGLVIRRKRISRASVVGKTISALCKVESRAKALAGDISIFFPRSRCFRVTQSAYPKNATRIDRKSVV